MKKTYDRLAIRDPLPSEAEEEWLFYADWQQDQPFPEIGECPNYERMKQNFFYALVNFRNVHRGLEKMHRNIRLLTNCFLYTFHMLLQGGNPLAAACTIPESDSVADFAGYRCSHFMNEKPYESAWDRLVTSMEAIHDLVAADPETRRIFQGLEMRFMQDSTGRYIIDLDAHLHRMLY